MGKQVQSLGSPKAPSRPRIVAFTIGSSGTRCEARAVSQLNDCNPHGFHHLALTGGSGVCTAMNGSSPPCLVTCYWHDLSTGGHLLSRDPAFCIVIVTD